MENKTNAPIDVRRETNHESHKWPSPPAASLARRAKSYSDFYNAVTTYAKRERCVTRKISLDGHTSVEQTEDVELLFDAQFAAHESRVLDESHARYQAYQEQLALSKSHLETLLLSTKDTLGLLADLSSSFQAVQAQTDGFREQCESLIAEQSRLEYLANGEAQQPRSERSERKGGGALFQSEDVTCWYHVFP